MSFTLGGSGDLKEEIHNGAVHVEGEARRGASLRDLREDGDIGEGVGADAAVRLGDGEGEEARLRQLLVILGGKPRLLVDGPGIVGELLAPELLGQFHPLLELRRHFDRRGIHQSLSLRGRDGAPPAADATE